MKNFLHEQELRLRGIAISIRRGLKNLTNFFNFDYSLQLIILEPYPTAQKGETKKSLSDRRRKWFEKVLQTLGYQESLKFSSADNRILREEITNDPILKNLVYARGSSNIDINTNTKYSPAIVKDSYRQRTFESVPIACLLYYSSAAIASSQSVRAIVNEYAAKGFKIPRILDEFLKSTRQSTIGPGFLTPGVKSLPSSVITDLGIAKTLFDFDWLLTRDGITAFMAFTSRLHQFEGNYIDFVDFSSAVPFNAGYQTTAMAWTSSKPSQSVDYTFTYEESVIPVAPLTATEAQTSTTVQFVQSVSLFLNPRHSYGETLNDVQAMDAHVLHRQIVDQTGDVVNYDNVSEEYFPEITSQQISLYVLDRVTTLKNGMDRKKKSKEDQKPIDQEPETSHAPKSSPLSGKAASAASPFFNKADSRMLLKVISIITSLKIPRKKMSQTLQYLFA